MSRYLKDSEMVPSCDIAHCHSTMKEDLHKKVKNYYITTDFCPNYVAPIRSSDQSSVEGEAMTN